MTGGWVYLMTNRANGTLYVGVTSDLVRRVWEHREGVIEGFTKRYGLKRLVWFERHETIGAAIQREKNIKHYSRAWKVGLILAGNRAWDDFYGSLVGSAGAGGTAWVPGTSPGMTDGTSPGMAGVG